VSIRHDLVLKALSGDHTITELAKEYGVCRKTAHKWVARFQGLGGHPKPASEGHLKTGQS
jgi:transposase-like protein